jgi:hypothetical protein
MLNEAHVISSSNTSTGVMCQPLIIQQKPHKVDAPSTLPKDIGWVICPGHQGKARFQTWWESVPQAAGSWLEKLWVGTMADNESHLTLVKVRQSLSWSLSFISKS